MKWPTNLGDKFIDWNLLVEAGGQPHKKCVLELGHGIGTDALVMAASAAHWTSLDIDMEVLNWVKSFAPTIDPVLWDLNTDKLPFESNAFDLVIDFSSLDDCRASWRIYLEIARVLKHRGHFITTFANALAVKDVKEYPHFTFRRGNRIYNILKRAGMYTYYRKDDSSCMRASLAAFKGTESQYCVLHGL